MKTNRSKKKDEEEVKEEKEEENRDVSRILGKGVLKAKG